MDTDVRLNLYRRLSTLIEKSELTEMIQEIHDRFGAPPPEVENLLALMSIRLRLKTASDQQAGRGKREADTRFHGRRHSEQGTSDKIDPGTPETISMLSRWEAQHPYGAAHFPKDFQKVEKILDQLNP
jgi:transcription-repair coupling factor (superfamily II helicase)